jgi:hypothetical protein
MVGLIEDSMDSIQESARSLCNYLPSQFSNAVDRFLGSKHTPAHLVAVNMVSHKYSLSVICGGKQLHSNHTDLAIRLFLYEEGFGNSTPGVPHIITLQLYARIFNFAPVILILPITSTTLPKNTVAPPNICAIK